MCHSNVNERKGILDSIEILFMCNVYYLDRKFLSQSLGLDHKCLCGSAGKESTYNAGDVGSIPGLGRSPGEGKGYTLNYSGLENSMDCVVHGSQRVGHD